MLGAKVLVLLGALAAQGPAVAARSAATGIARASASAAAPASASPWTGHRGGTTQEGYAIVGTSPWGKPLAQFPFARPPSLKDVAQHAALGVPDAEIRRIAPRAFLAPREGFVSVYDPAVKAPRLVSWKTTPADLAVPSIGRLDFFGRDPALHAKQPSLAAFMRAFPDYDAGHLKAQSFAPLTATTAAANARTYTPSNLIFQARNNNQGPYLHTEHWQKSLVEAGHDTYALAGPLYEGPTRFVGAHGEIPVPTHVFKLVLSVPTGTKLADLKPHDPRLQVVAVIIPNDNALVKPTEGFARFVVAPRELERRAGFPLLTQLPRDVRAAVMREADPHVVLHQDGSATIGGALVPAFENPYWNADGTRKEPRPAPVAPVAPATHASAA